jgi:hypothetical protein
MSLPVVLFLCSIFLLAGLAILADLSTVSARRVTSGLLWLSPVALLVLLSVGR